MTDPAPAASRAASVRAMPSRRWRAVPGAAGYVAFVALLIVVVLDGSLHRTDVVGAVERQPASVKYADGSTHYVGVISTSSWVLGRHRSYELYSGRDVGLGYGHFVRLGLGSPGGRPVIKTANWDAEGVRVTFASGHEVFVPARYYLGGR